MHQRFDLSEKVAIVTGASRGLGKAMALGLAEAGADVVVSSRTLSACEEVAGAIEALGRAHGKLGGRRPAGGPDLRALRLL
jgi:NAD(P)-dependent dehydrogenase (short-subunit alcohol dehydrogenase family)